MHHTCFYARLQVASRSHSRLLFSSFQIVAIAFTVRRQFVAIAFGDSRKFHLDCNCVRRSLGFIAIAFCGLVNTARSLSRAHGIITIPFAIRERFIVVAFASSRHRRARSCEFTEYVVIASRRSQSSSRSLVRIVETRHDCSLHRGIIAITLAARGKKKPCDCFCEL